MVTQSVVERTEVMGEVVKEEGESSIAPGDGKLAGNKEGTLPESSKQSSPKPKDSVSKDEKSTTDSNRTYSKAELELEVERRSQSVKDAELTPLYEERNTLRKENSSLKKQLTQKQEDNLVGLLEQAQEEGEDTGLPRVKDFGKLKELIKQLRGIGDRESEIEDKVKIQSEADNLLEARELALSFFLPDGADFLKDMEDFVKELAACKTKREKELLMDVKRLDRANPRKTSKQTDSSRASVGTGVDTSALSPSQKIAHGLKKGSRFISENK